MKYINLNQSFGVDRVKFPETNSDIVLTADWFMTAISLGYGNKLENGESRRLFQNISDKIKKVVDTKGYYIEINPVEEYFIKTGFDKCGGDPKQAQWIKIAEDAFLGATDTIPPAPRVEEVKKEEVADSSTATPETK